MTSTLRPRPLTPAFALAGILTQIKMALETKGLDAEQRLAMIAEIEPMVGPSVKRWMEQDRIAHDLNTVTELLEDGGQLLYTGDQVILHMQTVPTDFAYDTPAYRAAKQREAAVAATGQRLSYRLGADGVMREYVYTPDPREGPLSDEEVAAMLAGGWGNGDD